MRSTFAFFRVTHLIVRLLGGGARHPHVWACRRLRVRHRRALRPYLYVREQPDRHTAAASFFPSAARLSSASSPVTIRAPSGSQSMEQPAGFGPRATTSPAPVSSTVRISWAPQFAYRGGRHASAATHLRPGP